MSTTDTILLSIITLLIGCLFTYRVTKRVAHRSQLDVRIDPAAELFPDEIGFKTHLTLSVRGRVVDNLVVLSMLVTATGSYDIVVPEADDAENSTTYIPPHIEFTDLFIHGFKTLNNDDSKFYIPLGHSGPKVHINIHNLRAGATARFQILGTLRNGRTEFSADQARFFPGRIQNVDVTTHGMIARPWKTTKE